MRSFVYTDAVSKVLRETGDFQVIVAETAAVILPQCRAHAATHLLMEVADASPYTLEERIAAAAQVRRTEPDCKVALFVDERAGGALAERVKEAKRNGLIDQFIFSSVSAGYLAALLETM